MKFIFYVLSISLTTFACGGSAEKKVTLLDRPNPTELTNSKHVKQRNGQENKKRVEYYNSLQYKGAYKQN